MNVFRAIQSDYRKYKKYGGNFFSIVFLTQGFWAVFQYRIAHFCYQKITLFPFGLLCKISMLFWQKAIEITTGISLPASASIGESFYIGHFGGIILNGETVIGNNCNISQGVTIGISGQGGKRGVPVIGDNVYIGVNSVLVGSITIGDDVLVGACSLVTSNVEKGSVMLGVPAVKVSDKTSKGYI